MMIPTMTGHLWYCEQRGDGQDRTHRVYALAVGFGHAIVPRRQRRLHIIEGVLAREQHRRK